MLVAVWLQQVLLEVLRQHNTCASMCAVLLLHASRHAVTSALLGQSVQLSTCTTT